MSTACWTFINFISVLTDAIAEISIGVYLLALIIYHKTSVFATIREFS